MELSPAPHPSPSIPHHGGMRNNFQGEGAGSVGDFAGGDVVDGCAVEEAEGDNRGVAAHAVDGGGVAGAFKKGV